MESAHAARTTDADASLEQRHARRATVWLSMQPATLGGIPGAGTARSRRRDELRQDWQGTFAFRIEHQEAVAALQENEQPVVFEGTLEGERRAIPVKILAVLQASGLVIFGGSEEMT